MAGRPKREFSIEEVKLITEYALNNCKSETIANALEIPVNTLKRHFGRLMKLKRAEHRVNLRKRQDNLSKTNPAMAIFLGKNELDQVDKQVITDDSQVIELTESQKAEARRLASIRLHTG